MTTDQKVGGSSPSERAEFVKHQIWRSCHSEATSTGSRSVNLFKFQSPPTRRAQCSGTSSGLFELATVFNKISDPCEIESDGIRCRLPIHLDDHRSAFLCRIRGSRT